jgi:hypothetical protein
MTILRLIGERNAYPVLVSALSGMVALAAFAGIADHFVNRPAVRTTDFRPESGQLSSLMTEDQWQGESGQILRTALGGLRGASLAYYRRGRDVQTINQSLRDIRRVKAAIENENRLRQRP